MALPAFLVCRGWKKVTLQEILDMISLKYPHSYTNAQVVSIINDVQKRIFRTLYKPQTATTYDLIADNPFYPIDYSPENIIDVVVNGREYPYQNIKYDAQPYYYYITEDNCIGIYPTPEEDVTSGLTVFHYMEPTELSASNTSAAPDLDSAWHMLLVYAACKELAEYDRDGEAVNIFVSQYNAVEMEYWRSKRARPHQIKDVYNVGRGVC